MIDAHWFFGIVEEISDPLELGRVKVRPYNIYSDQEADVSTSDLQWATVIQGVGRSSTDNVGTIPSLSIGTTVFGFYADGPDAQVPMILGRLAGTDWDPKLRRGTFHDAPWLARPDVKVDTDRDTKLDYDFWKNTMRRTRIPTSRGTLWDEPANPYKALYPDNKVERTPSGHVFEVDDTDGHERIHTFHKSGTFKEIHPRGTVVERIEGDRYTIIAEGDNVYVKGTVNLTIDGDCNTYIKKNWDIKVGGSVNMDVFGNYNIDVKLGNFDVDTLLGKVYLN